MKAESQRRTTDRTSSKIPTLYLRYLHPKKKTTTTLGETSMNEDVSSKIIGAFPVVILVFGWVLKVIKTKSWSESPDEFQKLVRDQFHVMSCHVHPQGNETKIPFLKLTVRPLKWMDWKMLHFLLGQTAYFQWQTCC